MRTFLGNLLLAVTWAALNEEFSLANLALGYALGWIVLWFLRPRSEEAERQRERKMKRRGDPVRGNSLRLSLSRFRLFFAQSLPLTARYFGKLWKAILFVLFFIKELIVANLRMTYHVLTPHSSMQPAVVAVPLEEQSDLEVTLLANILTLTPGSFSVDVSTDRRVLYVHLIDARDPDATRAQIKRNFERRLLELLR